ncbi:MAG: hypothetical protein KDJ97_20145, partial [Anaerolineae bacterium]|nr:hypothetical protein [Anaerolineae bacterium]
MDQPSTFDQLLQQFCQLAEDDELQAFLQDHHAVLLTDEAEAHLAQLAQTAADEAQQDRVKARLHLIQGLRQIQAMADLPPSERLFMMLMAARSPQDINNLILQITDEADLDELEQLAGTKQAEMAEADRPAVQERLDDLRRMRQQLQTTFGEQLPLFKRLNGWIATDSWTASAAYLEAHAAELLTDAAEQTLQQVWAADPDNPVWPEHLTLLQESRALGIEPAYANRAKRAAEAEIDAERAQALADKLVAWLQQETLAAAETYLSDHQAELLTEEGLAVMTMLVQANPSNQNIRDHQQRLRQAQAIGIEAMYSQIRRARLHERIQDALTRQGPIGQAVYQFIQMENDETAAGRLTAQGDLLLTWDAGNLLNQLLAAAADAGDESLAARLQARQEQWQAAFQARVGTPLRPNRSPAENALPEVERIDSETTRVHDHQEALRAEMRSKYTVLRAHNCAIGDGAMVINNIERIPIRWQRPQETKPRLAAAGVGRGEELTELHNRLIAQRGTAVVSSGTSAAVRGQPAIGKTTLAAMYATRYADHYGGGVLWLDIGPQKQTAADAIPVLQRIASYAYEHDARAQEILENCEFSAERVQALLQVLLGEYGPLLVVLDDVWHPELVEELQQAFPANCYVLLTTRDYDVAFSLEETEAAIQRLDVLSADDARLLLQTKVRDLTPTLADRIAAGLGYHAQALVLAAGALSARKKQRHDQTAEEILQRVATGRGFGDLPRMGKTERLTKVEIALKYSYDYLAQIDPDAQQWFRALGIFAQEAEFDTPAGAAVWDVEPDAAEAFLLTLEGLALVEEMEAAPANATPYRARWQQHAIIRAYALSLQTAPERVRFPERHTDYYMRLARVCHERRPRDYDRLEQEFNQVQHAFNWCVEFSPTRVVAFTNILSQFMAIRGRSGLIYDWLMLSQQKATILDDRLGKANT